jgi:hypothetical protein
MRSYKTMFKELIYSFKSKGPSYMNIVYGIHKFSLRNPVRGSVQGNFRSIE